MEGSISTNPLPPRRAPPPRRGPGEGRAPLAAREERGSATYRNPGFSIPSPSAVQLINELLKFQTRSYVTQILTLVSSCKSQREFEEMQSVAGKQPVSVIAGGGGVSGLYFI